MRPPQNAEALGALTVKVLQGILRERGLPVSGRKAVLIERLLAAPSAAPEVPKNKPPREKSSRPPPPSPSDIFAVDATPRRTVEAGVPTLRVATWNVAGLRALLRGETGCESLRWLAAEEGIDVLLLQETKLQESHVAEVEPKLLELLDAASGQDASADGAPSWRAAWACSTARKGYSGVCSLWNAFTSAPRSL